ncbi:MAG: NAD(P)/FAD-dependent oxidoreductase [Chitinophagaceae bacterium]
METKKTSTLIIGASIAGLATAGALYHKGLEYTLIEKESDIAAPWRLHYERLHLHTNKGLSALPYKSFQKNIQQYPSRLEFLHYLEEYRLAFKIEPIFNREAISIRREKKTWITETSEQRFLSKNLVVATGAFGKKKRIKIAGMETFPGKMLHSSEYITGKDFEGKKVLVIGFGNSACEIALDLFEQGAQASMSLRSPVNVLPRDISGIPILKWSVLLSKFPPAIADAISAPVIRWKIGRLEKLGLEKKAYGPFTEIANDRKTPVIDVGTIRQIRAGNIRLFNSINRIEKSVVLFDDGRTESFDAIICATGFVKSFPRIEEPDQNLLKDLDLPSRERTDFGKDGLYFCGFYIGPTGHINEITKDALMISNRISLFLGG